MYAAIYSYAYPNSSGAQLTHLYSVQISIIFIKTYLNPCQTHGGCNLAHELNSVHKILMQCAQNLMRTDRILSRTAQLFRVVHGLSLNPDSATRPTTLCTMVEWYCMNIIWILYSLDQWIFSGILHFQYKFSPSWIITGIQAYQSQASPASPSHPPVSQKFQHTKFDSWLGTENVRQDIIVIYWWFYPWQVPTGFKKAGIIIYAPLLFYICWYDEAKTWTYPVL